MSRRNYVAVSRYSFSQRYWWQYPSSVILLVLCRQMFRPNVLLLSSGQSKNFNLHTHKSIYQSTRRHAIKEGSLQNKPVGGRSKLRGLLWRRARYLLRIILCTTNCTGGRRSPRVVRSVCNLLPTFRGNLLVPSAKVKQSKLLKMKSTRCPETTVTNPQTTLRNIPEDRRCRL